MARILVLYGTRQGQTRRIATGIADEIQASDNAKAFLVTRGLAELTRLAHAMGAEPATAMGLAGIGDLM